MSANMIRPAILPHACRRSLPFKRYIAVYLPLSSGPDYIVIDIPRHDVAPDHKSFSYRAMKDKAVMHANLFSFRISISEVLFVYHLHHVLPEV